MPERPSRSSAGERKLYNAHQLAIIGTTQQNIPPHEVLEVGTEID
jgi:hypothetical protein